MKNKKIAIIGTVGVPANYGGFETLVENLVRYQEATSRKCLITVYCSSKSYPFKESTYLSARLKYIPFNANGLQSIAYDILALFSAAWRDEVVLLLGVSGAIVLPLVRLLSPVRIITNIDGIEWRREKWRGLAKWFLRFSEKVAVRFSHEVISDNAAIANYVKHTYGVDSHVIAYGGDHAVAVDAMGVDEYDLPKNYACSVCRIEPENNVHVILKAFSKLDSYPLVIMGNWSNSDYGLSLRKQYASHSNLFLLDAIYDLGKLKTLRARASNYIHGHSAGGTNPSLVEAMHFGKPIFAFDCKFNRNTTEDKAFFFKTSGDLIRLVKTSLAPEAASVGCDMVEIAKRCYTWRIIAQKYFALLGV